MSINMRLWRQYLILDESFRWPSQQLIKYQVLHDIVYSALSISHGIFSPKNSEKTPHSSPWRVKYEVSFASSYFEKILSLLHFKLCLIVYMYILRKLPRATTNVQKNKSYVGLFISYVGLFISYVGLIKSYVGLWNSYVGLSISYVGDKIS